MLHLQQRFELFELYFRLQFLSSCDRKNGWELDPSLMEKTELNQFCFEHLRVPAVVVLIRSMNEN